MITIFVGGEGEPKNLEEVLALILGQFPKRHMHSWPPNTPPSPITADISIEEWCALPLHSLANGQETRVCPCGSHVSIALVDFDAPEPKPFGEPTHLDELVGEPEHEKSDREIYREEAPYGSEP